MDRRSFLRLGVGSAALLAAQPLLARDPADAQPAPGPFGYGVASGDPLADRVILWTRVTPDEAATPGSGLGAPTEVEWEVATDEVFAHVIRRGTVTTDPSTDHTVKVDADGLPAATDLWYRFIALGITSPAARTRTLPASGAAVESMRIGVVCCSNYEGGFFSAYRHLAGREDLDFVAHLGDYVYEYGNGAYGPGPAIGRLHDPGTEMVRLEDYRRRHAIYKTDPDLALLHRRYAFVATLDDHEVTDNSWADGAVNHQAGEGSFATRKAAALQAFFEWMPIRVTGGDVEPTRVWRQSSVGELVDLFVLDERSYRSRQIAGITEDRIITDPAVAAPDRTMLGAEQLAWLESGLDASGAPWKVIVNPVMFSPFILLDLPDLAGAGGAVTAALTALGVSPPVVLNGDQWDGYRFEQERLRDRFGQVGGVVLLTGDVHSTWAAEVPADPGSYLPGAGGDTVAVEFVTPAVTSDALGPSLADLLPAGLGSILADNMPELLALLATWFKYVDLERHGFGVLEVTSEHAHQDWFFISDRTDPQATVVDGPSFRTFAGSNKLEAAAKLGPRPLAAAPTVPVPAPEPATDAPRLPATGATIPPATAAVGVTVGLAAAAVARRASVTTTTNEEQP